MGYVGIVLEVALKNPWKSSSREDVMFTMLNAGPMGDVVIGSLPADITT